MIPKNQTELDEMEARLARLLHEDSFWEKHMRPYLKAQLAECERRILDGVANWDNYQRALAERRRLRDDLSYPERSVAMAKDALRAQLRKPGSLGL